MTQTASFILSLYRELLKYKNLVLKEPMSAKQSSCFAQIALTLVRGYFHLQHGQRGSDRLPVELPWPEMGWISLARGRGGIAPRGEPASSECDSLAFLSGAGKAHGPATSVAAFHRSRSGWSHLTSVLVYHELWKTQMSVRIIYSVSPVLGGRHLGTALAVLWQQ